MDEAELNIGAAVGITAVVTLLVSLPVGVVLGCWVMWCWMRSAHDGRRYPIASGCRRKKPQAQEDIYEDPVIVRTTIALSPNDAYSINSTTQ